LAACRLRQKKLKKVGGGFVTAIAADNNGLGKRQENKAEPQERISQS